MSARAREEIRRPSDHASVNERACARLMKRAAVTRPVLGLGLFA